MRATLLAILTIALFFTIFYVEELMRIKDTQYYICYPWFFYPIEIILCLTSGTTFHQFTKSINKK